MGTAAVTSTTTTITEALAEIATIGKRIAKRQTAILPYIARQNNVMDPMRSIDGGSTEFIRRERQAVLDLMNRLVQLRMAIQRSNQVQLITIDGETRSIADWLTWRKEILPVRKSFLGSLRQRIEQVRKEAQSRQIGVVNVDNSDKANFTDLIVNISESELVAEVDHLEMVEGTLDGQLSLRNATTVITI